jgi:Bacteriophage HK97-gp10, putative tail-component
MARGGVKFTVKAFGVEEVMKQLGKNAANELANELDGVVEKQSFETVNDVKANTPVDTGRLVNSIDVYEKPAKMARIIGSPVEYATRQEYEHKSKKGFFRKALFKRRTLLRKEVEAIIQKRGR